MSGVNNPYRYQYEPVPAGTTDQVMGGVGAKGDYLHRVIVSVATAATGTCSIKDGGGTLIPLTAANTPIGVYSVLIEAAAGVGPWTVTTGAGATAVGVGIFSA